MSWYNPLGEWATEYLAFLIAWLVGIGHLGGFSYIDSFSPSTLITIASVSVVPAGTFVVLVVLRQLKLLIR